MDLRHSLFAKLFRYASVSVATTVLSLSVLSVLVAVFHVEAVTANVIATICGIGPSYYLNRRWVWRHPESRFARHVMPFWAMSLTGLVASSLAVHVADRLALRLPADIRTLAILAANVAAFGTLWLIQFVINDRLLFRTKHQPHPAGDVVTFPVRETAVDVLDHSAETR
jgi:putative flippase GtrA